MGYGGAMLGWVSLGQARSGRDWFGKDLVRVGLGKPEHGPVRPGSVRRGRVWQAFQPMENT